MFKGQMAMSSPLSSSMQLESRGSLIVGAEECFGGPGCKAGVLLDRVRALHSLTARPQILSQSFEQALCCLRHELDGEGSWRILFA